MDLQLELTELEPFELEMDFLMLLNYFKPDYCFCSPPCNGAELAELLDLLVVSRKTA